MYEEVGATRNYEERSDAERKKRLHVEEMRERERKRPVSL